MSLFELLGSCFSLELLDFSYFWFIVELLVLLGSFVVLGHNRIPEPGSYTNVEPVKNTNVEPVKDNYVEVVT